MTVTTATPLAIEPAREQEPVAEATCPKCQTTTPWKDSSWCPDCGYYPGISDAVPTEAQPQEEVCFETEEVPDTQQKPLLPGWVTASISGATGVIVLCIAADYYFTYYGGDRSLVSLIVLATGTLTFLTTHIITSIASMQESSDVAPFDIIGRPIEMWRPTIHGLPKTGKRIVFGVCGISAALSALMIIGGLDFNSIFEKDEVVDQRPGVFKRIVTAANDAAPTEDQPETIEDALAEVEPVIEELDAASSALLPSPDEPLQCVVYGYMDDGKDGIGRLLLAAEIHGARVHVGTIEIRKLPTHIRENLKQRLPGLVKEDSNIESRYRGTWVQPSLAFNLDFQGWSMSGELIRPRVSTKKSTDP